MSNGKKFILMVAAIVIPFILALGIALGVLIVKGGGDNLTQSNSTYNQIKSMNEAITTTQPINSSTSTTTEKKAENTTFEIKDTESAKNAIIGKWEKTQNSDDPLIPATLEFFEDGTYQRILNGEVKTTYNGRYSFSSPDRIKFITNEIIFEYGGNLGEDRKKKDSTKVQEITFIKENLIRIVETDKDSKRIQREYQKMN